MEKKFLIEKIRKLNITKKEKDKNPIFLSLFVTDQRQANASLVAHLPTSSSTTLVFDHPIIGFDQDSEPGNKNFSKNFLSKSGSAGNLLEQNGSISKTETLQNVEDLQAPKHAKQDRNPPQKVPHAPTNSKLIRALMPLRV